MPPRQADISVRMPTSKEIKAKIAAGHTPTGRPPGRPKWEPSDEEQREALNLIRGGATQVMLSNFFDKDEDTIRRVFGPVLRRARLGLLAVSASQLTIAINKGEEWAIKFYFNVLMARELGLDKTKLELTGANGGPISTQGLNLDPEKLRKLPPDELAALKRAVGSFFSGDVGDPSGGDASDGGSEFARAIDVRKGKLAT